jgi:nitrogen fixation/metabolism regulation signal transduction histidine kinase
VSEAAATPPPGPRPRRHAPRRVSLQLKLAVALVLIVLTPLGVSAYLIDQLGKVAANFAASEAAARGPTMRKAIDVYRELFETTKRLHAEIADRLAKRADLLALDPKVNLDRVLDDEPGLYGVALRRADGQLVAEVERALPGPQWREKLIDQPLGKGTLHLTFAVSNQLQPDLQELKAALDSTDRVSAIRTALPDSFRTGFLILMGIAVLAAAIIGVGASTFVTRRIAALVTTARKVSDGKLDARVALRGHDEMAELGRAFNTMLDDLDQTRAQIAYLQRIGAWEDVARRLAHEIKNPLTPIQLAVQQTVSSYKGDDPRFARLLKDTGEIVEEEIAGLRRLVDTFRTLGQLPKVEPTPIALRDVVEELTHDPALNARLTLAPPPDEVTVRADKLLLKRVLANLVENGMHAGQEAGTAGVVVVGWAADPKADVVTITVDDQGKGVTAANRERIFEPYVTTKATGTGLGLAIAKKIAIEHGGDLVVDPSPAPTGGARFVITLPLTNAPAGPEASRG